MSFYNQAMKWGLVHIKHERKQQNEKLTKIKYFRSLFYCYKLEKKQDWELLELTELLIIKTIHYRSLSLKQD